MITFDAAFNRLIAEEGGFVNDQLDRGGKTKFGISQKSYPNLDIKNLTLAQAKSIYKDDYWDKSAANIVTPHANFIFDTCVNMGIRASTKILQGSLGLNVDGYIGPITLDILTNIPWETVDSGTMSAFRDKLLLNRMNYYLAIVKKRPEQIKFLVGWLNRATRSSQND